jgi:hypothetical protein
MSAPSTNIEKQKRRHKPALIGIFAMLAVGAVMFLAIFFSAVDDSDAPAADATPAASQGN